MAYKAAGGSGGGGGGGLGWRWAGAGEAWCWWVGVEAGCTHAMHGCTLKIIDPRTPT